MSVRSIELQCEDHSRTVWCGVMRNDVQAEGAMARSADAREERWNREAMERGDDGTRRALEQEERWKRMARLPMLR